MFRRGRRVILIPRKWKPPKANRIAMRKSAMATASETASTATAGFSCFQPGVRLFTAADLAAMPRRVPSGSVSFELHHGRLVAMSPPGATHGNLQSRIATEIDRSRRKKGARQVVHGSRHRVGTATRPHCRRRCGIRHQVLLAGARGGGRVFINDSRSCGRNSQQE